MMRCVILVCDVVRERLLEKMDVAQVGIELLYRCLSPHPRQTQGLGADNPGQSLCTIWCGASALA